VLDNCILSEELAAGCMGIYVSIFVSTLALYPIIRFGTEGQKERFLKPFCSKFSIASYCLSEVTVDRTLLPCERRPFSTEITTSSTERRCGSPTGDTPIFTSCLQPRTLKRDIRDYQPDCPFQIGGIVPGSRLIRWARELPILLLWSSIT